MLHTCTMHVIRQKLTKVKSWILKKQRMRMLSHHTISSSAEESGPFVNWNLVRKRYAWKRKRVTTAKRYFVLRFIRACAIRVINNRACTATCLSRRCTLSVLRFSGDTTVDVVGRCAMWISRTTSEAIFVVDAYFPLPNAFIHYTVKRPTPSYDCRTDEAFFSWGGSPRDHFFFIKIHRFLIYAKISKNIAEIDLCVPFVGYRWRVFLRLIFLHDGRVLVRTKKSNEFLIQNI